MPYSSFANNHKQLLPRQFTCHVLYFLLFLYVNLKMRMNPLSFKVHILADIRQNKTSNEQNRKSSRTFDKIGFRLQRQENLVPRAVDFGAEAWRMLRRYSALSGVNSSFFDTQYSRFDLYYTSCFCQGTASEHQASEHQTSERSYCF